MKILEEESPLATKRKLPWLADIFFYPTSTSGMIHMVPLLIAVTLFGLLDRYLLSGVRFSGGGLVVLYIILIGYILSYFAECIRDSAGGGVRAPETFGGKRSKGEIIEQYVTLFACYAFFFGPVTIYHSYIHFSNTQMNGVIFWSLLAYGVFFFPMGILAVVMFDSVNGLNPILIICSIASTLFHYFGLFIFLASLCVSRVLISILSVRQQWELPANILLNIVSIWLLLVAAHLIGRFYWRCEDKLNWEV